MKTTTELMITTTWHNIKRSFYTAQLFIMTLAIPVLFYIGLTHDVKAAALQNREVKQEQTIMANMPCNENSQNRM